MRDWFANAFGSAVSDIREKLLDESWFQRSYGRPPVDRNQDRAPEPDELGRTFDLDR